MKSQQDNNDADSPQPGVNYVEMLIDFAALPLELTLHNVFTFGVRSAGARAAGAVLVMYLFGMFYTYDDRTPLFLLMLATALLAVIAHVSAMIREGRGESWHSRYNGRPYALAFLPISEIRMKRIEPSLFLVTGWVVHHWNHPLGSFVMTSASCQCFRMVIDYVSTRARTLDLNDALTEQTAAMQAVRRARRR